MNWLKKTYKWLKAKFTAIADKVYAGLKAVEPYLVRAVDVAAVIAEMTPNRTDDEIIRAIKYFGIPIAYGSTEARGEVLRRIAFGVLRREFPDAPDRQLNRAIEVAVGAQRP